MGSLLRYLIAFLLISHGIQYDIPAADGVVEEYEGADHVFSSDSEGAVTCCQQNINNVNLVLLSLMNGKILALDANHGGQIAWQVGSDDPLLSGTLGKTMHTHADQTGYALVPALDGTMYMYSAYEGVLEPANFTTDAFINSIRMEYSSDVVSGGKVVSTTGVDPISGKVRYHCTASDCSSSAVEGVMSTLILRRATSSVHSVDALTGIHKWNLSVAEYDADFVTSESLNEAYPIPRVRILLRPAEGIVTAYDPCGGELWSTSVGNHIVKAWTLQAGYLKEVTLFEAENIYTFNQQSQEISSEPFRDSLLYFGTYETEPFIVHSRLAKAQLRILAKRALEYPESRSLQIAKRSSSWLIEARKAEHLFEIYYDKDSGNNNEGKSPKSQNSLFKKTQNAIGSCASRDAIGIIDDSNLRTTVVRHDGSAGSDKGFLLMDSRVSGYKGERESGYSCYARHAQLYFNSAFVSIGGLIAFVLVMVAFIRTRNKWKVEPLEEEISGAKSDKNLLSQSHEEQEICLSMDPSTPRVQVDSSGSLPGFGAVLQPEKLIASRSSQNSYDSERISPGAPQAYDSKFLREFEPLKILGKGGFGIVFKVRNSLDQGQYAVKRVAVDQSQNTIDKVLREVRAMATLDHPAIIRYYHTWLEEPPIGWQDETDRNLKEKLRTKPARVKKQRTISSSRKALVEIQLSATENSLSHGIEAPPMPDGDSDGSWLNSEPSGHIKSIDSSSSSSSSDESSIRSPPNTRAESTGGVVFDSHLENEPASEEHMDIIFEKDEEEDEGSDSPENEILMETSNGQGLVYATKCANPVYLYIQMQLCPEGTLHSWLAVHKKKSDRPIMRMKSWFGQICSAVGYIHQRGLIHRDLKPQNIFFVDSDTLKVGDLGLVSNTVTSDASSDGPHSFSDGRYTNNIGTRSYMSPEQLHQLGYTSKVDVFSLGLIYLELLVPFATSMERLSAFKMLQEGSVPDIFDDLDKDEADLLRRLTAYDAECRPTCREILDLPYFDEVMQLIDPAAARRRLLSGSKDSRD